MVRIFRGRGNVTFCARIRVFDECTAIFAIARDCAAVREVFTGQILNIEQDRLTKIAETIFFFPSPCFSLGPKRAEAQKVRDWTMNAALGETVEGKG